MPAREPDYYTISVICSISTDGTMWSFSDIVMLTTWAYRPADET